MAVVRGTRVWLRRLSAMSSRWQITNRLLMVQPTCFKYNPNTAADNRFQKKLEHLSADQVREKAWREFEGFVGRLREHSVLVDVEEDRVKESPDAVFPNNWISFHEEGKIVLHPMMAENRRRERSVELVREWREKLGGVDVVDYTGYESEGKYLEGTGSMVLDRVHKMAYACLSERTHSEVLGRFCEDFGYSSVIFHSSQLVNGTLHPIYHTNVMMCIGETFAVVGLDTIRDKTEQNSVRESLEKTGKKLIEISEDQVDEFAGNVLEVRGKDGRRLLVMSSRAHRSFSPAQLASIRQHCDDIVHTPLDTIETLGGGGARCMLAEVFPTA